MTMDAWMMVLDRIEESVRQSLQKVADPPPAHPQAPADGPLPQMAQHLDRWEEGLQALEEEAVAAQWALDGDEEALRLWLEELQHLREEGQPSLADHFRG